MISKLLTGMNKSTAYVNVSVHPSILVDEALGTFGGGKSSWCLVTNDVPQG